MNPINVFREGTIPSSILGTVALPTVTYTSSKGSQITQGFSSTYSIVQSPASSQRTTIYIHDGETDDNGNGEFKCSDENDKYSIGSPSNTKNEFDDNCVIDAGDARIKIDSVIPSGTDIPTLKNGWVAITFDFPGGASGSSFDRQYMWLLRLNSQELMIQHAKIPYQSLLAEHK